MGLRSKMLLNLKKFVADFDKTKMSQSRMYMGQYGSIGMSGKNLKVSKSLNERSILIVTFKMKICKMLKILEIFEINDDDDDDV